MANDDLKKIKELLEIVNNKVSKLETHVSIHTSTMHTIKDQQSATNEKLDSLQSGMDELNKKSDGILEFAEGVDDDLQDHKKRLTKIERIPVIAHELNK